LNNFKSAALITNIILFSACSQEESSGGLHQENRTVKKYSSVDATAFDKLNICASEKKSLGIVAGYKVRNNQDLVAKSTVKIFTDYYRSDAHCTGVIIGPRHIVSAAHCFKKNINGTFNKENIRLAYGTDSVVMHQHAVESLYVHPKYNGIRYVAETGYENKDFHDLATLVIDGDLENLSPVSLLPSRLINPGQEVILAGYGSYLQTDKENRALSRVSTDIAYVGARFRDFQLSVNEKGACFGDSGGPMYVKHPEKACLALAGTVTGHSRGKQYKCEDGGGTITDVSRYQGWLKCVYEKANQPLSHLEDDDSASECR
jgi:hypothetical protein